MRAALPNSVLFLEMGGLMKSRKAKRLKKTKKPKHPAKERPCVLHPTNLRENRTKPPMPFVQWNWKTAGTQWLRVCCREKNDVSRF
jgi:hypothetical protein